MAATAATQFLPFLEPAEEEALLAAAPVRSYAPDELVFDQNVSLRAIFLIDRQGRGARRAPGPRRHDPHRDPRRRRVLR